MTTLDEATQKDIISFIKDNLRIDMDTEISYDYGHDSNIVTTRIYLADEQISEASVSIPIPESD
jgi:hypothetical protein